MIRNAQRRFAPTVIGITRNGDRHQIGISDRHRRNTHGNVEAGTTIHSDEHGSNWKMDDYEHQIINHLEAYVRENCHTNGMENFWALLKRSISGTYVSVEPFHLFRYVDEQAFRFNNRTLTDSLRFRFAMRHIVGRHLTYAELTGKTENPPSEEIPF